MKHVRLSLLLIATVLAGCNSNVKNTSGGNNMDGIKITTQKIVSGADGIEYSYIGTIEASVSIPLSFLIAGTAEQVNVEEGQSVKRGQLLATLNEESYRNAYHMALAKEEQAQDAYNRLEPVYRKGSLPEVKFVEIKSGLAQANAAALLAKGKVADCKLFAPTSGIIGRREIEPGMSVIPGNPAFRLVKISKVKVKVPVPENEIAGISKGLNAVVKVSALGEQQFKGQVTEIGVISNPLSHTYGVKVELDNPDKVLKPGMICSVNISNPVLASRIVIPLSAVQTDGNGKRFVFIADAKSKKAKKKYIETGALVTNGVTINKGLSSGDLLITEGYQKLEDNSTIQIIK
ncbi:efflux RND transporter periplasmic adaptor subunit [Prolixibacter sp. SD074]|uniref:efflux RND transporter periplasmic adaptor subunit n=1 Tax=Prolixibacter sp. SD074 TaxID=2652391 RepID=UPI00188F5A0D|nr:efflux RND transporter periplasmic adaptor subunit [Prolixibacter sp. SD074]